MINRWPATVRRPATTAGCPDAYPFRVSMARRGARYAAHR